MKLKFWRIYLFVDQENNMPVFDYMLDGNDETKLSILINVIQRLSRVGLNLMDTKMVKLIDKPIYELRKHRHRILFAPYEDDGFILLSAFLKETQKTPPEEIQTTKKYYQEFLNFHQCQEMDPKYLVI